MCRTGDLKTALCGRHFGSSGPFYAFFWGCAVSNSCAFYVD